MNIRRRLGNALSRAECRRSLWRLLALPLGFACAIGIFLFLSYTTLRAQIFFGPDDVFFCTPSHLSSIVLLLTGGVLSLPVGLMVANLLLWMVPPARAALELAELQAGESFATANAGLAKFVAMSALMLLPIFAAAARPQACLSDSQVYYRPQVLSSFQAYDLSQLAEVRPRCTKGSRGGWDIGLEIEMTDGVSLDLAVVGPWFSSSSQRILAALGSVRSNSSQIDPRCPSGFRNLISP